MNAPSFPVLVLDMNFRVKQTLWFAPWKAGNFFRGKLGFAARRISCPQSCPGPASCPDAASCPYARLFEPQPAICGPSGFTNLPRPFVLRAEVLNERTFHPGDHFSLRLHLFGAMEAAGLIEASFATIEQLELLGVNTAALDIPLTPSPCSSLQINFLTPMEIKWKNGVIRRPDFPALVSRLRDRIASIATFYGSGPLNWDFNQIAACAESIRMTQCDVREVDAGRRSSRTGQTHGLGGFIGQASYKGGLDQFLPMLRVAEWIGIGRHTSWGNGAIRLSTPGLPQPP